MKRNDDIICLECGNMFHPRTKDNRFCCRQCSSIYRKKHGLYIMSEETRKRLSESCKGRAAWNKGKKSTQEQIDKFRISVAKVWTDEKKEQQRQKQKEVWSNVELLERQSKIAKEHMTDEHRNKISKCTRDAMQRSDVKEHIQEGIIKSFDTKRKNGSFSESKQEGIIKEYIEELGFKVEKYQVGYGIKKLEIDIYIPEKRIGFEYNGMYWHSNIYKDKNYHYHKTLAALEKGIKLIHIWEWEDIDKIKAFIYNILIEKEKLNARDCECKEVDNEDAIAFYNTYHLQGAVYAKDIKHYGLYYNNELVAMRSYARPRFKSNKYDWEDIRYAVKTGLAIRGALSKLWKRRPEGRIVSYQNLDKFPDTNNSFEIEGFKKVGHSITCYYKSNMDVKPTIWKTRLSDWVKIHPEDSDCSTFEELLKKHNGYEIYTAGTITWLYTGE